MENFLLFLSRAKPRTRTSSITELSEAEIVGNVVGIGLGYWSEQIFAITPVSS